jgi:hypothetical protein
MKPSAAQGIINIVTYNPSLKLDLFILNEKIDYIDESVCTHHKFGVQ